MPRLGNAGGRTLAVGLMVVAGTYAAPARAALDLTGTWTGKWSCKDVTTNVATKPSGTVTMTVTQTGGNANAMVQWTLKDGSPAGFETYQGHVQELTAKPGQGATTLIGCETRPGSSLYAETLSANAKVTSSNATLKGTSTYEQTGAGIVGGTCKYSFKRTTTADPGIAACPACGNGIIEAGEQCDGGNLNGQTCATQVGVVGLLLCGPGCTFDTTQCYGQRFARNRSVDGNVTVTDHQTNLQWEMKTDDGSVHDKDNTYTLTAMYAGTAPDGTAYTNFLATLNTSPCYAGHCDWRLPTIDELQTILLEPYPCGTNPCIDNVFGPTANSAVYGYWSGTTLATYYAYGVFFGDGLVSNGLMSFEGSVRAVRSGS